MSYTRPYTVNDSSKAGATLTAQLFDSSFVDVGAPQGGAIERSAGQFGILVTIPDGHAGGVQFLFNGTPYDLLGINPRGDVENADAKVSTRSSHAAADVWAVGTRTLSSFGTLVADVTAAVWAAGARTLTAFGFNVTVATNNDKTGYALTSAYDPAKTAAQAGDAMALTGGERTTLAGVIWAALTSGLTTVGSIGKLLVDRIDAAISSRMATFAYTAPDNASITAIKAKTDNLPSDPADASDIASSFGTVNTTLATIAGYVDTEVAAIKAKTDLIPAAGPASAADYTSGRAAKLDEITAARMAELDAANIPADVDTLKARIPGTVQPQSGDSYARLGAPAGASVSADIAEVEAETDDIAAVKTKTDLIPGAPAAVGSAMTLTTGERTAIATALLDLVDAIEAGITPRGALRVALAALAGKLGGAATTTITIRDVADTKDRIVATVTGTGDRTATVVDPS